MSTKKQILIGVIIGLLTAFLISLLVFFNTNPGLTSADYFKVFFNGKLIVPILSISLLGNLAAFFIFIKFNKDYISRGILIATVLIGLFIFIIKFIL